MSAANAIARPGWCDLVMVSKLSNPYFVILNPINRMMRFVYSFLPNGEEWRAYGVATSGWLGFHLN